jgi:hypothetical protein
MAPPDRCSCWVEAYAADSSRAEPSLTDLDDGDLKAGTDFRSIYATLLDHVLGADPAKILSGYSQQVDKLIT